MCSARTAARCWPRAAVTDGNGGRDYTISFVSAKGTITPASLTVTAVGDSRVYNGTTSSSGTPTFGPLFGTDSASFTQAFQSKDVLGPNGSTLLASGSVADGNGGRDYTISFVSAKGTITPAALTVTAVGDSRVYDGTTSSSGTPTFGPLFGTDSASFTQAFQSKDVLGPNGSTLLASGSVADGNGGRDYTISFVSAKGTITPAALTVTAVGDSRVYDGTTSSSGTPTFGPLFGTDSASFTQAFQSKDVLGPNGSTLLASGSVADGNGGRDYTISFVSAKGTITPAALTVTAVGDSRVYNGTTSSSGTPTFGPLFGTDSASFTQAFQSKDVLGPNGSTLLASGSVDDGNGGRDYTISFVSAKGTITPAALTVTAVGDSRVYDGTTSSSGTPTFGPLFGTDSASFTQAFQSKDVLGPNGSTLLASGSVADGNGGRDYTISFVSAKGTITPAALTVTAVGDSRVYDGTTSSSGTPTFGPLFGTDSASFTQAFQSKDVLGPNGSTLLASGRSPTATGAVITRSASSRPRARSRRRR